MNTSAQKALIDALSQHSAYLYRASSQSVNELTQQFNRISNAQLSRLSELLNELSDSERKALKQLDFKSKAKSSKNIQDIKSILNEWFKSVDIGLSETFHQSALPLAIYEANYAAQLIAGTMAVIEAEKVFSDIQKTPYSAGQLLDSLFTDLAEPLRKKVEYVIRDGVSQGQSNQQIIQRIKGRQANDYKDGLLESVRSSIERQVRTARSHISTATYIETYKALGYEHVRVVATLDGRTCHYCAFLDGKIYQIDDPKRPHFPVHPNNRTTYVPCEKDGEIEGQRPFVADDRKVKDIPQDQRNGKIGQVDANTTFKDWFAKQDANFQEEWLGPSRFQLYKHGQYSIDKFIDPQGRKYTLDELKKLDERSMNVKNV